MTTLHRAAQEAITNARKHGDATTITVTATFTDTEARLEITDNGQGFDPSAQTTGYGLLGLRERAALAGGKCTVDSHPGNGTRVTVTVPANTLAPT
ncbi:MAG: ATP-binding protein [Actinomycetota bacterium]|nr:ATP-binding protein [Actinomycetota bacterium]